MGRGNGQWPLVGIAGTALLWGLPAHAQSQFQEAVSQFDGSEIIVTAQRRQEAAVDVPITITSLGAEQLEAANVSDLTDIAKITPTLRFDFAGAFFQPTVRGIGTAVVTSGGGSNVGIYVDGFYSPNPLAADFQLMKLQSIQVLKGPQGTLFGRNTTGGAILVQTAEPSTETNMSAKVSIGRFNEMRAQGYVSVGLAENIALDLEGSAARGDGWQRDLNSGRRVGGFENTSVRFGLKADLTEKLSVLLRYQHSERDDPSPLFSNIYVDEKLGVGAPNFAAPDTFTTDPNKVALGKVAPFLRSKSNVVQGTVKADLGFADFTSYTQYRAENANVSLDTDRTANAISQIGLPNINRTFSQELLLTGKSGGVLQWTAGLFYMSNKDRYITFLDNNLPTIGRVRLGGSSTTTQTYAGFVDLTYALSSQLFVTAGLRYAHDKVTDAYFNPVGTNGAKRYVDPLTNDKATPRLVVRYKPDNRTSIYASYSKGYKAGIIDVGGATGNRVRPESINAFEIGFKREEQTLSIETAAFYYDYKDLQISLFHNAVAQIVNAASSEIYGIEGQARFKLSSSFDINAGGAWVHARYKQFDNAPIYARCPTAAGCGAGASFYIQPTDLKNVTMQRTPEFTGNVGARYKTMLAEGSLTLSGNLYYSSKFFFGPSGIQYPQNSFETLSLRAQWSDPSEHLTIGVWGDNVTNNRHLTQVQYNNFAIGANWNKPVTYGVDLGVKF